MTNHAVAEQVMYPGAEGIEHEEHPGAKVYLVVAAILIVLTALEVTVFYAPFLQPALVPLLIVLAIAKFALVAMFYMHLHYDHRLFSVFFVFPLWLALLICLSLMLLFEFLSHHLAFIIF